MVKRLVKSLRRPPTRQEVDDNIETSETEVMDCAHIGNKRVWVAYLHLHAISGQGRINKDAGAHTNICHNGGAAPSSLVAQQPFAHEALPTCPSPMVDANDFNYNSRAKDANNFGKETKDKETPTQAKTKRLRQPMPKRKQFPAKQ